MKFLYQVNVDDPLLYDVVLNTERLMADEGARLVQEALHEPRFQTSAASQRDLVDLGIVAGAKAALMASRAIGPHHRVLVSARGGSVCLSGTVDTEAEWKIAQEIVEKMLGVTGVLNEITVVPRSRSGGPLVIG